MRAHFAQKVLPLALCFAAGVGLAAGGELLRSAVEQRSDGERPAISEAHSRTWLFIESPPKPLLPFVAHGSHGLDAIQLRARFGADGKVSQVAPLAGSTPPEMFALAAESVERVKFTPPTEDGRPLAVTADVTYEVITPCACYNDMIDNGRCDGGHVFVPLKLKVKIVSVEGAKNPEGWRVVYE